MISDIIQSLEEGQVQVELMLGSGTGSILRHLAGSDDIAAARQYLKDNPQDTSAFLDRANELFNRTVPDGYHNPNDRPLAAHLYVLGSRPAEAQALIEHIASPARRDFPTSTRVACWLVQQIAQSLKSA